MEYYKVQIKIYSSAQFFDGVKINGYNFDSNHSEYGSVLVTKNIKAETYTQALEKFYSKLNPLLNALSFHRLSAVSAYGSSFVIAKHSIKRLFSDVSQKRKATGLSLFGTDKFDGHFKEIKKLTASKDISLFYFRHAMMSEDMVSQTYHLLQTCESLSGEKESKRICPKCEKIIDIFSAINHKILKEILGGEVYCHYYQPLIHQKKSIRTKLSHGMLVDQKDLMQKIDQLIEKIKVHLKEKYHLAKIPDVRSFRGLHSIDQGRLILGYKKKIPLVTDIEKLYGDNSVNPESFGAYYLDDKAIKETLKTF